MNIEGLPRKIEINEQNWLQYANCKGVDPELFYPAKGERAEAAREVCRACVVKEYCEEYAFNYNEKFGVWAGLTEGDRRRIRRQRAREVEQEQAS